MNQITIGLPSNGFIRAETTISIASALSYHPEWRYHLEAPVGAVIHQLRQFIAEKALKAGSSYLLFIDSDIVFPPDAIVKLVENNRPVIGADYNYKYLPKRSVTNIDPKKIESKYFEEDPRWPGHKFLSQTNRPDKPFEVRAVGTGFMLIKTEVFKKIPKPWFWFEMKDGHLLGEDVWFCDRAREAGFSVWCDPTIQIEHIGTTRF